jgi:predicted enzyme related to lactoylglutathione lyase
VVSKTGRRKNIKLDDYEENNFNNFDTCDNFFLGFAFKSITTTTKNNNKMKRVTGIGGIFFKCKDPKATTEWYQKYLGLDTNPYGATFEWYEKADSTTKAQTQWTPFKQDTKYFDKDFMINYRVENLEALVEELKKEGVTIVDKIETFDYGKFVHILDSEGNKIQLWQPVD